MAGTPSSFAAIACCLLLASPASADTLDEPQSEGRVAEEAARAGMFLPLTEAPRTDSARAFMVAIGGYDGANDTEVLEGRGEVTVYGPIAVRLGVLHTRQRELRPTLGARVQALSQLDDQGIDMSIGLFYKPEGFTEGEGEIEAVLALGRRFGRFGVIGDLAYGQDPEARERDGELRLAELYTLSSIVELGLDSRLRFDLGTEDEKLDEEGGAEVELLAGPLISVALGNLALGAEAGVAVVGAERTHVGMLALATISGAM